MSAQDDYAREPVRPPAERWAAESPFVGEAVAEEQAPIHPWYQGYTPFVEGREMKEEYAPEAEWEPRAAALVAKSPFVGALEERRSRFDEGQLEEEEAPDELEGEEELETEKAWEELEEEQLTPQADQEEEESLDDEGTPLREDETELESPEDLEELYSYATNTDAIVDDLPSQQP